MSEFPEKIEFEITEEDINNGESCPANCPTALALNRKYPKLVFHVYDDAYIFIRAKKFLLENAPYCDYDAPDELENFVRDFDEEYYAGINKNLKPNKYIIHKSQDIRKDFPE